MRIIRYMGSIRSLLPVTLLLALTCAKPQNVKNMGVIDSPVDDGTVIRFFFQPPTGNYFHAPLVFRIADKGDIKANTAPIIKEGRTAYISSSEMQQLLRQMGAMNLLWQESKTVEAVESYFNLPLLNKMAITVFSTNGVAKVNVSPDKVCQTLAPLNAVIATPRAQWELKFFESMYFCKVTGFDSNAYPDHNWGSASDGK